MRASDVVVVGGGPAGLYAASSLARAGCGVTLLEEHADIGEPVHCTGVLAKDAFEEFRLDTADILNQLTTVRFHAPSGRTIEYSTRSVEAVVIDRASFDRRLAREAVRAGVRLIHGRAMAISVDPDGVTVSARTASVRARACVLACGASYAMQRDLGLGMPKLLMRSAQVELPAERLGDVEVHFGRNLAPGGFAWAVPVSRGDQTFVRVGVMCHSDAGRHFHRVLEHVAPRWGVRRPPVAKPRTYADRLLVVGDAAGLVKPTTGGGIYYSLLTASLAAETLAQALESDDLGAERLSGYEASWRQRLDPELRSQLLLRRIAQRLSDADIDGLFELATTDGIVPLIRQTAAFNHHREFIVALLKHPPARRLLFRAAFA
jgi:geranylgeranyl reductase family protein